MFDPIKFDLASRYISLKGENVKIKDYLGGGTDGDVWKSSRDTALKVFKHQRGYYNERDTYERLGEYGLIQKIDDFWVPQMIGYDDDLMVVEMDVMHRPPYIIDFAKVRLNNPPEFSEDVMDHYEQQGREQFEHHWPKVKSLMSTLESYQIYYLDPRRGNIAFPDMP